MVALSVAVRLKPNCRSKLALALTQEIHPALQKMKGFSGQTFLVLPEADEAVAFSLWDTEDSDQVPKQASFKTVLGLAKLIEGSPKIKVCKLLDGEAGNGQAFKSVRGMVGQEGRLQIFEVSKPFLHQLTVDGLV